MRSIYDNRNHKKLIEEVIKKFYGAYYAGEILELYSCLETGFQRRFPLNYFMEHERFQQYPGALISIQDICVDKSENSATAELFIEKDGTAENKLITLRMDYGGWKLSGDVFPEM